MKQVKQTWHVQSFPETIFVILRDGNATGLNNDAAELCRRKSGHFELRDAKFSCLKC